MPEQPLNTVDDDRGAVEAFTAALAHGDRPADLAAYLNAVPPDRRRPLFRNLLEVELSFLTLADRPAADHYRARFPEYAADVEAVFRGRTPPGFELHGVLGRGGMGVVYQAREVELCGWNVPPSLRRILLAGSDDREHLSVRHSGLANAPRLRLVPHPVWLEDEESTSGPPQSIEWPGTVSGRIDPSGDSDRYRFEAGQDEGVLFEIEARRLGSPIDAVLRVRDPSGKELSRTDDSADADPRVVFKAPAAGGYFVEVTDLFDHGGFRYVYALHATRPRPDYGLTLAADHFVLTPGKELEVPVSISRENGFSGEVEVGVVGLPAGVTVAGETLFVAETTTGRDGHVYHALPIEQTLEILARHGRGPR